MSQYKPVASMQSITVAGTAVGLTVPTTATRAILQVLTANVRYAVDTSTATASLGFQAQAGDLIYLYGPEMQAMSMIREGATSATVIASYWTGSPDPPEIPTR